MLLVAVAVARESLSPAWCLSVTKVFPLSNDKHSRTEQHFTHLISNQQISGHGGLSKWLSHPDMTEPCPEKNWRKLHLSAIQIFLVAQLKNEHISKCRDIWKGHFGNSFAVVWKTRVWMCALTLCLFKFVKVSKFYKARCTLTSWDHWESDT